jgi:putative ABC transport system substrate-binding protein
VRDGGLLSYAANIEERFHRAASYVDRILKGAKPGELPIEQPTKFQLVVNAKTSKVLGIEIPSLIFAQADEVIE